jgi:hypothetical protein
MTSRIKKRIGIEDVMERQRKRIARREAYWNRDQWFRNLMYKLSIGHLDSETRRFLSV